MESRKYCVKVSVFLASIFISATAFFTLTDARHVVQFDNFKASKVTETSIHNPMKTPKLSVHRKLLLSEAESTGISTPFALPPFESISPLSSPSNNFPAPLSVYPPFPPNFTFQSPPPTPPHFFPSPPSISPSPNPPLYVPSPPTSYGIPIPPNRGPILSPPKFVPTPPISRSPPPPAVRPPLFGPPPPPHKKPQYPVWCVAKPTVPDSIMQEAMDYACGSGADCKSIQPNGRCFQPNTLFAHASYAFNSYWQKTKVGGGTCDFGGTAILVTADPSFDDCQFIFN
ncbi:Glucan endo-1,3-beta-glucosidase [Melia azedarach]|uniref:Glucan endo-1,3-beta-glucosidase n=1 Tax=Melia azedarach TaxID=155640 RepID=A0ACC1X2E1_MELAZ|nr:Glucan endo-1,3-beta-glucosidase [Melia azedarach]